MTEKRIRDLKGLGAKSELALAEIGINSVEHFMATDPFVLYAKLKSSPEGASINFIYAIIGAQQDIHWQEVKQQQRQQILMQLDDMGLAP